MFVELQHPSTLEALYRDHVWMTVGALVRIFGWRRSKAESTVAALWQRYDGAPADTRDRLVHEDPVNLAAELAGRRSAVLTEEPYRDRLQRYDAEVRKVAEGIRSGAKQPVVVTASP